MDRAPFPDLDDSLTHHGFTGHEQMDEAGLIHMNGRIYSPFTMRFTSPDPFVQDPGDLQSYNRYSYVLNNPLVHTDPSGYWGRKQQGYLREAAGIALAVYTGYYWSAANLGASAAAGAAASGQTAIATVMAGYTSGFITSGSLKGSVLGGLDAGLNFAIGSAFPVRGSSDIGSQVYFENVGAHALEGGVLEVLRDGKFGHGFFSAGVGAALSPAYSSNPVYGGIEAIIVGGTVSEATGGKFANGAMTTAFEYAFNSALHSGKDVPKTNSDGFTPVGGWRYLTDGEKQLIASDALDVKEIDDVHVIRGGYRGFEGDVITPNGNIYVGTKASLKWSEDYSLEDLTSQSVWIHESVHLYQHNTLGWSTIRMGISRARNSSYDYVITPGKSFSDYGMEEQAQMVQDRFLLQSGQPTYLGNPSTLQQLKGVVP